jgi:MFS family permease
VTDPSAVGVPARQLSTVRGRAALVLLCSAFLVDVMGATSVFTASPAMQQALHLSATGLQWAIIAATLPAGALLLAGGRLADRYGPRRMFLTGLGLFLATSLACGLAPDAAVLIVARAGQGVAGAVFLPAALSLVLRTFGDPDEQRTALAAWSAIGGVGATAGLLLGGAVTAGLGWRWVFFVNVPIVAVLILACPVVLAEVPVGDQQGKTDVAGTVTFSVGVGLVIYAITEVPDLGWADGWTLGPGLAGLAAFAVFTRIEITAESPILPSWLVRSPTLVSGNATLLVAGMCVDGLLFTLTLFTQRIWGFGALEFGSAAAVMTLTSVGMAWIAQRAIARFGTRPVIEAGLAMLCLTGALFGLTATTTHVIWALIVGMVVFGLGMGCVFVAGSVASLHEVSEDHSGVASAVQNISFTMGSALGVAVLSTVAATTTRHLSSHPSAAALTSGYRAAFVAAAIIAALGIAATLTITNWWFRTSSPSRSGTAPEPTTTK